MALFAVENLIFTYPDQEKAALDQISFSLEGGEFVLLCGKSGCGKSTLLRHFKTAMSPYGKTEGRLLLDGRNLSEVSVREQASRIGYVMQSPDNQLVTDKVWHELAFGMENLGYDSSVIRLRVAEMASFFGIQNWFMKNVEELSGGQKQLLNLASVMTLQPDILILDEPTSQLDPLAASDFLSVLRKINQELGTTIVLSEHRLEEAMAMADRVLVMDHGKLIADDAPGRLADQIKTYDIFQTMPVPMRMHAEFCRGLSPVTVKEGREWFSSYMSSKRTADTVEDASVNHTQEYASRKDGPAVLQVKDVWFRYEKHGPDIVQDLNFSVNQGQIYCILGGNGTGKSTTLSLISGLKKPYRGTILWKGKKIKQYASSEFYGNLLGILPQNPQNLFVKDTLEKDLRELCGKNTQEEKLQEIIDEVEIRPLLSSHPYDLSGGEQQRAALAKILLRDPEILLLDEPTKGLDGFYKKKLADIFLRLKAQGKTIIMVSHDIEFCAEYGDMCGLFFHGNMITSASSRAFFRGNSFYTTTANRIARNTCPDVITYKDLIQQCKTGGTAYE